MTLQLNTLGDAETRDAWRAALVAHFEAHRDQLSDDSIARLDRNPLRILDSKDPRDRPVADSAPDIDAYLTVEARAFFDAVTAGLDAAGVAWTRNPRLVRGLDYYRHTAFEFVTDRLGAQGTVLAGGRYDGLIGSLGGPETPGVGWAAGVERLAMLVAEPEVETPWIVVVPDSPDLINEAVELVALLRGANISVEIPLEASFDMAFRGNAKRRVELARKAGASAILFLRTPHPEASRLRLMHLDPHADGRMALLGDILAAAGRRFGGIEGSGPA